ncbi:nicotinate-nucleotide--dimethylbenzimidazole phosphoribosyltransferase [Streptomyces sp. NPDC005209]|uniref:nicotinate-nucleotide--dimethylbenzimidazole phosphoribosyltransferase n=1 Tax=Streptomyces sp. NPDC005209 TaxID=3156715 RepID=UPI0033B1D026
MTDTGQVPGEGLPESAGRVEQPGVPAHGMYTYLSETTAEDEDLLLPGAQSAWGNEVPPPAPEPVVEAVHEPGPHETAGRDSGSVDLSGVRLPDSPVSVPPSPILSVPHEQTAQSAPRRPLHLGPPIPDASASPVRSLADRGPAGAPVRQAGAPTGGPEYLDVQALREMAPQSAAPWGAPHTPVAQVGSQAQAAETVVPVVSVTEPAADPSGAAQAAVTRLATQAAGVQMTGDATPAPGTGPEAPATVHGHDGMQPAHGHDGVYAVPAGEPTEGAQGQVAGGADVPDATMNSEGGPAGVQGGEVPEAAQAQVVEGPRFPEPVPVPAQGADIADAAQGAVPSEGAPVQEVGPAADAVVAHPGAPVDAPAAEQDAVRHAVQATSHGEGIAMPIVAEAAVEAQPQEQQAQAAALVPEQPSVDGAQQPQPEAAAAVPLPADEAQAAAVPHPVEPVGPEVEAVQPTAEPGGPQAQPSAPIVVEPAQTEPVAVAPASVVAPEAVVAPVAAAMAAAPTETATAPTEAPAPAQGPTADADAHATAPLTDAPVAVSGPAAPEAAPEPAQELQPGLPSEPGALAATPVAAAPGASPATPVPEAPAAAAGAGIPVPVTEVATPDTVSEPGTPVVVAPVPPSAPAASETAADPGTPEATTQPGTPEAPAPVEPTTAEPTPLPGSVPLAPRADQPLGQFVPVEGTVPTTPHLAPTPPQPLVLPLRDPQGPVASVPAPREAEPAPVPAAPQEEPHPEVVQHAEDLDTRVADQEESTAAVAEAQPSGPAAPGYDVAEREAVLKVMRERRDIRNGFRSDPIPHEVLLRVLEAAHTAPSVGHSQPWDFVVIRSAETRRTMHELAMSQRDAYAKSLPKGRAKQFKELKIEAILDTPVNIVVTADPTRGGRHTLGRHTQPQMAPYSAALAVENLWLAARAEGLGVGWVSFFDEREMVRTLGLPEHLEVIAYLCVGYVDEFPDEPELMQAGWSKRRPLSWVVHEETYGRRALPGEDPHDLLNETVAGIRPLDAKALGEAWERQKRMTKPAGALGMLEIISAQLAGLSRQCPPPIPEPAAVAIFAGDHGVHAQGVTPWPQEVTAQMVANFLGGGAVCNAFANQVGAEVCVVDVGVAADLPATPGLLPRKIRAGTSDMTTGPAMTREEAKAAIEVGIETARDLVAAGNKALLTGEMGIANTTASAALISVFTGADPAEVTGRGTGINDETLARKTEVVRRAIEFHQPDPADPIGVLAAIGGFEHAAIVGLLLGGASLRTPVILDGVSAGAAALVARAIAPEVLAACIAGHRSAEPGHVAALNKLGLRPLVDLDLRLGEGTGALLALPLVQSTARAMHEVATFDSAGVTEK